MKKPADFPLVYQYSHQPFFCFCIILTYFAGFILEWLIRSHHELGTTSAAWIVGLLAAILRCLGAGFMWIIWAYKTKSNSNREQQYLGWLENSYHVLIVASLSLRVGTEVLVGRCISSPFSVIKYVATCNRFHDVYSVNPTYIISLMLMPLLAHFFIRETRVESIATSWLISVGTLIFCAVRMNSQLLVHPIIIYICGSLAIYYDTKRQNDDMLRLVAALQATAKEVERLQEETRATELRAMIGNVAHDLKTPLTSILSGIECIEDTMSRVEKESYASPSGSRALEHVASVRACLKSMSGTSSFMTMCINRCLDYTKASKGVKLVPKPETVNLQEALDFPISIMRDVQTQLPITLAPVPAEICSHIITDKQWLMENVLCLLSNAVRYSQAGSVDINVFLDRDKIDTVVNSTERAATLRIEVCDGGIGLTDEMMTTLFTPFKQAQRLAGGTGLGLFSLAKRVEALHGQYGVCKRPDKKQGSMFWFSIPYRPDNVSATHSPARHLSRAATVLSSASLIDVNSRVSSWVDDNCSYSVLVVDDSPSILKMTTMLLKKKGHMVETATNGAVAVMLVSHTMRDGGQPPGESEARHYDVVLMDLQMPVMDGIEAIRRIRAAEKKAVDDDRDRAGDLESGGKAWQYQARPRRQLIIALSANSDSETMQEALDAGADHFMSKPFGYDTFNEFMREHPDFGK